MKIARNHEVAVLHIDDFHEFEEVVKALAAAAHPDFPVPVYISDSKRTIQVNSLNGFVATIRLEDFVETKTKGRG